jgi:hypothetical protein
MRTIAFNIQNIDDSLRASYNAGKMTIEEIALEYYKAGHTNFIDLKFAEKRMTENKK